jgi:hypothetical protein
MKRLLAYLFLVLVFVNSSINYADAEEAVLWTALAITPEEARRPGGGFVHGKSTISLADAKQKALASCKRIAGKNQTLSSSKIMEGRPQDCFVYKIAAYKKKRIREKYLIYEKNISAGEPQIAKKEPTQTQQVAESTLPDCRTIFGIDTSKWTYCIGTMPSRYGAKYVGGWKDGQRHGQGTFTFANGTIENGIWNKGKLVERNKIQTQIAKKEPTQTQKVAEKSKGYLGIRMQDVTSEIKEVLELDSTKGALVALVHENSPAYKAGIKPGDIILEFDSAEISDMRILPQS